MRCRPAGWNDKNGKKVQSYSRIRKTGVWSWMTNLQLACASCSWSLASRSSNVSMASSLRRDSSNNLVLWNKQALNKIWRNPGNLDHGIFQRVFATNLALKIFQMSTFSSSNNGYVRTNLTTLQMCFVITNSIKYSIQNLQQIPFVNMSSSPTPSFCYPR